MSHLQFSSEYSVILSWRSEPLASLFIRSDSVRTVPVPQNGSYMVLFGSRMFGSARLIIICASFGGSIPRCASRFGFL